MRFRLFLLLMIGVTWMGCSDEMEMEEDDMVMEDPCDGTSYTYSDDIMSIIDNNCALSGCHDGGGSIPDFSSYAGVFQFRGSVKNRTQTRNMPPAGSGRSLTDAEIQVIGCWVDAGAPE